jgi:hypothetical protein
VNARPDPDHFAMATIYQTGSADAGLGRQRAPAADVSPDRFSTLYDRYAGDSPRERPHSATRIRPFPRGMR